LNVQLTKQVEKIQLPEEALNVQLTKQVEKIQLPEEKLSEQLIAQVKNIQLPEEVKDNLQGKLKEIHELEESVRKVLKFFYAENPEVVWIKEAIHDNNFAVVLKRQLSANVRDVKDALKKLKESNSNYSDIVNNTLKLKDITESLSKFLGEIRNKEEENVFKKFFLQEQYTLIFNWLRTGHLLNHYCKQISELNELRIYVTSVSANLVAGLKKLGVEVEMPKLYEPFSKYKQEVEEKLVVKVEREQYSRDSDTAKIIGIDKSNRHKIIEIFNAQKESIIVDVLQYGLIKKEGIQHLIIKVIDANKTNF